MHNHHSTEQSAWRQFHKGLKKHRGTLVSVCPNPKCGKTRERTVYYTDLEKWAYKDGICVEYNGRGCCY